MRTHRVQISGTSFRPRVMVDGTNTASALAGLTLTMRHDHLPALELDLNLVDVTELADLDAQVILGPGVAEALVALGWTPPADQDAGGSHPG